MDKPLGMISAKKPTYIKDNTIKPSIKGEQEGRALLKTMTCCDRSRSDKKVWGCKDEIAIVKTI